MRGIGQGQKVHIYITPEVAKILQRELTGVIFKPNKENNDHVLEDVVATLTINSLKSEQMQWTMLCVQNIGNLYRKNAFKCLRRNIKFYSDGLKNLHEETTLNGGHNFFSDEDSFIDNLDKFKSLNLFDETIDYSLEAGVPDPVPFEARLHAMLQSNNAFLTPKQIEIGQR
jgi:hypothetical protein